MKRVWTHFFSIFFIALLTSGGIYTNSYFFDTEGSEGNVLASTYLDGEVLGGPLTSQVCADGGSAETQLQFRNSGALAFFYNFVIEDIEGDACGDTQLEVYQNNVLVYDGALLDFSVPDSALDADSEDSWRVKVKFPAGLGETGLSCNFNTAFSAQQGDFLSGQAFYDREDLSHNISVIPGAICGGPSVDLHLSKAISGEQNGFELSDFSYRVTGPGIDTVVPHDGTIPLPEGVYTIEELVPEGFVKGDWRIGWYGACDRGDTFFTTITIDEGNIDHGTLYCQADNQYRPENNPENTTEEELADTETATTADDTLREERDSTRSPRREAARGETTEQTVLIATTSDDTTDTTSETVVVDEEVSEPITEEENGSTEEQTETDTLPEEPVEEGSEEQSSETEAAGDAPSDDAATSS